MKLEELCPNSCSNNGKCQKIYGCQCNPGFIEYDCSVQIKCKKDCSNNGLCHNDGRCGCYPGWAGILCDMVIPCKNNCTSSINGVCQSNRKCKCNKGYSGCDCSIYKNITKEDEFQSLIEITEKQINTNCKNNCSNNGSCNEKTKICACYDEFIGEDCSINIFKSINLKVFKQEFLDPKLSKPILNKEIKQITDKSKINNNTKSSMNFLKTNINEAILLNTNKNNYKSTETNKHKETIKLELSSRQINRNENGNSSLNYNLANLTTIHIHNNTKDTKVIDEKNKLIVNYL